MFSDKTPRLEQGVESQEGFTVVEMIVALGIVLTLALLIFQGYGSVIRASQKSKCVANLRAIGGAEILYAADNNGWFVPNRAEHPGVGTVFWCQELLSYLSGARVAYPKVGESPVFVCPRVKGPFPSDRDGYDPTYIAKLSYAQNIYLGGGFKADAYGYPDRQKLASVSKPSQMVLVAEANRVNIRSEVFDGDQSGLGATYRHNKEMNLLFVDGHVESSRYPVTSEAGNSKFNWRIEDEKN